jgi:hypothetical protein
MLCAALGLLTGCADGTVPPPSAAHPASPNAAEGTTYVASSASAPAASAAASSDGETVIYTCPIHPEVPGYMAMGETGMGGMQMTTPKNTLPMMTGKGPFGDVEMGGMFTVIKVRDGITSYADPGWFKHPPGTVARKA